MSIVSITIDELPLGRIGGLPVAELSEVRVDIDCGEDGDWTVCGIELRIGGIDVQGRHWSEWAELSRTLQPALYDLIKAAVEAGDYHDEVREALDLTREDEARDARRDRMSEAA